jgi:iron(III) transport system permease protein
MTGRGQTERSTLIWSAVGLLAASLLPWYALQEGLAGVNWVAGLWSSEDYAGGIAEIFAHGKWWLAPALAALVVCAAIGLMPMAREHRGTVLAGIAATGLVLYAAQGLGIGLRGWSTGWLNDLFGEMESRQVGIGAGGTVVLVCLLALFSTGLALRGAFGGDTFVSGAVTAVAASIVLFTAWPILRILVQAFQDGDGAFLPSLLIERLGAEKIWSLRCLTGGGRCGVAWNTLFLALARQLWGSPSR